MRYVLTTLCLVLCLQFQAQEEVNLGYYLPQDMVYNSEIPTPQEIIGFVPGEWHVSHDQLLNYMRELARVSPRISLETRGKTYENRPLILLTITAEENHRRIDKIREEHLALTRPGAASLNTREMPVVVNQGFSIHGNEASGSNAALLVAYHLAAAEGPETEELLQNTIILFDPAFNPDGLQRFSYWANSNKSTNINPDPQDREYNEIWPGGRSNHYWFDMNRDWLPVQLPESEVRLETFHLWQPNILTDHHEMGSNSSFFFQPGIPSRTHPLTPDLNQELTREIGNYHASAFDEMGTLYFTEEYYDDFYYGKGSTFPDINGSIGILFEQGSSRGHAQETENGILTFPFTIRNQFTAALSTLEAAREMRVKLLDYQRDFYKESRNSAANGAWVFGNEKDASSAYELAKILKKHRVKIHEPRENFEADGKIFRKGSSYIVPKDQRQHRLVEAMFEKRTEFQDSLFYDISAWSFPLAFNQDFSENVDMKQAGEEIKELRRPQNPAPEKSEYAYLMQWHDFYTPKALNLILKEGLRAKVAMQPFGNAHKNYDYGSILIPVQNQHLDADALHEFLSDISSKTHIQLDGVKTGLTSGINLGSNQFKSLKPPKVALLVGDGITPADAGEIWHLFDQRYDIQITKLDTRNFSRTDLRGYTDIIIPNTQGTSPGSSEADKLKNWVRKGGTLIGYRNMAQWFDRYNFMNLKFRKTEEIAEEVSFEERRDFSGAQGIGGAIFEAKTDRSHPVNFGYKNDKIALFRNTTIFVEPDKQSYKNPIKYTKEPLLSGYISEPNLKNLAGSVPFKHARLGKGHVILFTDNTNFRAFWFGTNKLLMNAVFFGDQM